ncbi:PIG-L family deacetylase [Streptomyces sp. NPDC057557]|uniref:PIG-L family deacetylase n=1 Tax=Streptomyces sp. NPDC057557 TaxID=3346167 RepID=UPI00369E633B
MHHPVTSPARHRLFCRLAARNRIAVAYRNLPGPLIPEYLAVRTVITSMRALCGGGLRDSLDGHAGGLDPDVPPDEVIAQLVAHIRQFRPDVMVPHDVLGQLTGHPDHRRTHQLTLLAVEAAALARLYPEAGEPWQTSALYAATHTDSGIGDLGPLLSGVGKTLLSVPDEYATAAVDVREWLDQKWAAICSHRSQLQGKRSLPALLSRLDEETRARILSTECYTRITLTPPRVACDS